MKKIFTRIIFTLSALLISTSTYSQGVNLEAYGYSGINKRYSRAGCWGVGYEHNFGEKLSLGLTYKKPFSASNSGYGFSVDYGFTTTDGNVRFSVNHSNEWQEFYFSSKYFFNDNSDGSYYIASGISLLLATNNYKVNGLSKTPYLPTYIGDVVQGDYQQSITLFPFALDLGHRSNFEDIYLELYVGMQMLPLGANPDVEPKFLADHGVETRYVPISVHSGISLGYSWKK